MACVPYLLLGALVYGGQHPLGLYDRLSKLDPTTLRAAFGSTAGAMALLGGFIISATFTFATNDSPSLAEFRKRWGPQLSRILVTAFLATVVCVGLMIASLLAAPLVVCGYLSTSACLVVLYQVARVAIIAWLMLQSRYRDEVVKAVPYRRSGSNQAAA